MITTTIINKFWSHTLLKLEIQMIITQLELGVSQSFGTVDTSFINLDPVSQVHYSECCSILWNYLHLATTLLGWAGQLYRQYSSVHLYTPLYCANQQHVDKCKLYNNDITQYYTKIKRNSICYHTHQLSRKGKLL